MARKSKATVLQSGVYIVNSRGRFLRSDCNSFTAAIEKAYQYDSVADARADLLCGERVRELITLHIVRTYK
jgi:hypothetical protein